jgi:hypothetical protein
MGRACSMHGVDEKYTQNFGQETWKKETDHLKVDLREVMWEGLDWSHFAQDRD